MSATLEFPINKRNKSNRGDRHGAIPAKVTVLDSDVVTFETVIKGLHKVIPGMTIPEAEQHALRVHTEGYSVVWEGDLELAEAYAYQLKKEGIVVIVQR
jgi:ATP-dependent Clp protease adaptor protein ClpS